MEERFDYKITHNEGVTEIQLKGVINEKTPFASFLNDTAEKVVIDLEGIERINSCGIREWIQTLEHFLAEKELRFINCSVAMVHQFNLIHNFGAHGRLVSLMLPYYCEACDREIETLSQAALLREQGRSIKAPEVLCPECDSAMVFDDLESKYFHYLSKEAND